MNTPLWIEVERSHFVNLTATIEIERDPDGPANVMITLPASGYEPAAPLVWAVTGELAELVLSYVAERAAIGASLLLAAHTRAKAHGTSEAA